MAVGCRGDGRVEFLDLPAGGARPVAVAAARGAHPPRSGGVLLVLAAVLALGITGLLARAVAAPGPIARTPAPRPVPTVVPLPVAGQTVFPVAFGRPTDLATAARVDDVVWVRSDSGSLARVAAGWVTTTATPGQPATGLTVTPDGSTLFATAAGGGGAALLRLDAGALNVTGRVTLPAPPSAVTASGTGVWVAVGSEVLGFDHALRPTTLRVSLPGVSRVDGLWAAVGGGALVASVTRTDGRHVVLRLDPATGLADRSAPYPRPISVAPVGPVVVVATDDGHGREVVGVDPLDGGAPRLLEPLLPTGATVWPTGDGTDLQWAAALPGSAGLECYDAGGQVVGRAVVGDDGRGLAGPVVWSGPVVYSVIADGRLARGGRGSCD